MLAFEVFVDGERVCVAGMEDWAVMSVILTAVHEGETRGRRREGKLDVSTGGLTEDDADGLAYHARWPRIDLAVGSQVTVNILDIDDPDPPLKRYRSDRPEKRFTDEEIEEMEREDYVRLKAKFEPEGESKS